MKIAAKRSTSIVYNGDDGLSAVVRVSKNSVWDCKCYSDGLIQIERSCVLLDIDEATLTWLFDMTVKDIKG